MGIKLTRRVFKIGQSHALTLPPAWVEYHCRNNDKVTIIGGGILLIAPAGCERQAEELASRMEQDDLTEGGMV